MNTYVAQSIHILLPANLTFTCKTKVFIYRKKWNSGTFVVRDFLSRVLEGRFVGGDVL